jgi:hypothetical protein
MRYVRNLVSVALISGIPALLLYWSIPRFIAGWPREAAQPMVQAALDERPLTIAQYAKAAADLSSTLPDDGDDLVDRAEMIALASKNDHARLLDARQVVVQGLENSPANPRGWTLLCEIDAQIGMTDATSCFETAIVVGPFDWFLARRRAILAAYLWPSLDPFTRAVAARRVRLMWGIPDLHRELWQIMHTSHGPLLVAAALDGYPDDVRRFNRWYMQMNFYGFEKTGW